MEQNRVCCLYRVSTDKQVDYDNDHAADIPMQRKACHKFAEKMGWNIVHEEQEDGESEKTSIRTKTSLGQMVEEGHFKGGSAPYGYDLVKSGRFNKRKHELYDLRINKSEAELVKLIFDKYTNEGYGTWRIANFLNSKGYKTRKGKNWHQASIRGILGNLTYTGVLRCGEARSPILQELQIIKPEQFETASKIFESRSERDKGNPKVPINTRGKSLLAGNVFCGHCGARLTLTTNGRYRKLKDGSVDKTPRIRYVCYEKTRKQTECDGQTGYTMHKLDEIVEKVIKKIFHTMRGVPKSQIISSRYEKEVVAKKTRLTAAEKEYSTAAKNLNLLKEEIVKCLNGQSSFSRETLAELISDAENKCLNLETCAKA